MTPEKQDKLYIEFPELFRQKDLKPNQTLMTNGIAVGDGWYDIIVNLCNEITAHAKRADLQPDNPAYPEFFQIKNSFGELRIRMNGYDPEVNKLVEIAQARARFVCESCGKPGIERPFRGWHKISCYDCFKKIPFWKF